MKIDLTVNSVPVSVTWSCPHCGAEIEIPYSSFCSDIGEPCDWMSSKFECPKCEKEVKIDYVEWD
jgi:predicted RNA-binding Zn-ribbon protein involved in translation (DUF1610 family)